MTGAASSSAACSCCGAASPLAAGDASPSCASPAASLAAAAAAAFCRARFAARAAAADDFSPSCSSAASAAKAGTDIGGARRTAASYVSMFGRSDAVSMHTSHFASHERPGICTQGTVRMRVRHVAGVRVRVRVIKAPARRRARVLCARRTHQQTLPRPRRPRCRAPPAPEPAPPCSSFSVPVLRAAEHCFISQWSAWLHVTTAGSLLPEQNEAARKHAVEYTPLLSYGQRRP